MTPLLNGWLLVAGGVFSGRPTASVILIDPHSGKVGYAAPMNVARARHAAIVMEDGRVLVMGGFNGRPFDSVEVYDPASDTWTVLPPLPSPRADFQAVVLPYGIWLSGGTDGYRPMGDAFYTFGSRSDAP